MAAGLSGVNAMSTLKVAHTRCSLGYLHEATAISGKRAIMADASPELANDTMERRRRWTIISIYLASIVERADEQILPALYYVSTGDSLPRIGGSAGPPRLSHLSVVCIHVGDEAGLISALQVPKLEPPIPLASV